MSSPLNLKKREAFDIGIKGELDDFLQEKQIPTLVVPPRSQEQPVPAPVEAPQAVVTPLPTAKSTPKPVKRAVAPQAAPDAGSGKKVAVSAYMPEYVYKALRKRAFEKEMSVTAYILHALALAKIPVNEKDLVCDCRKTDPSGRIDILKD